MFLSLKLFIVYNFFISITFLFSLFHVNLGKIRFPKLAYRWTSEALGLNTELTGLQLFAKDRATTDLTDESTL